MDDILAQQGALT
jgi:hypothetical protein